MKRYDEIAKLLVAYEAGYGSHGTWDKLTHELFGRAVASILSAPPTDQEIADRKMIYQAQKKWDGATWALWYWTQAEMSRQNIERWLATTHLRPNLSAEGLKFLFHRDNPDRRAQDCHFFDIQEVK
jgi:hypothetical protein